MLDTAFVIPMIGRSNSWFRTATPACKTGTYYAAPDIRVRIADAFRVSLDGAMRDFVTTATLETSGDQTQIALTGTMLGGWEQPFGVAWLDLDTVGITLAADGVTASASLHSSFELGGKSIALEMAVSGGAESQSARLRGSVDSLSLGDFIELARKHLGAQADPFGDSSFDFTFTDVGMTIETGSRPSFSLGGKTELNGVAADALFSASYPSGGGSAQLVTGFQLHDWSLADALDELKGTFVEEFRLETVALVFSKGEGSTKSSDMGPETRAFYQSLYGTEDFTVPFRNGLSLLGRVPLAGHSLNNGLDALGMSTDALFLSGTIPGSIIGLGGCGGLGGLSLFAGLPPVSPPGSPEWFVSGQLGLEITAQPSVGLVGSITTLIELESMPEMAVRSLHLKFAPRGDPDLGVEAGFAVVGELWVPSEANGPPNRNFAAVELTVDLGGIVANGHLGAIELGPIAWDDASVDMTLSLLDQHLFIRGAAEVGSFFQGNLDVAMTRAGLSLPSTVSNIRISATDCPTVAAIVGRWLPGRSVGPATIRV